MGLEKIIAIKVGGEVRGDELGILAAGLDDVLVLIMARCKLKNIETYYDSTLAPATIPMTANEADPVALTPNTRADGDFGIQLNAHLEIAFEAGFRNRIRAGRGGIALESIDHGIEISLLRSFDRCWNWSTVDSFMKDRVVGVVFLHGGEVVRAFE